MRFRTLLAGLAGLVVAFGSCMAPSASAQETKKEPEIVKVKFKAGSSIERTGWSSHRSGLLVATDKESYAACWQLLGSGQPLIDPVPFNEKYIYLFVVGGHTNYKPGHKVEVTGVTRTLADIGPNARAFDSVSVEATVTESTGRRIWDDPRSPCVVVRIERTELTPDVSPNTRFLLTESRVSQNVSSAIDAKFYAPGGRWLVSYKAGESKKAQDAIKEIGMKLIEDYEKGNFLVVEVTAETRLSEIDRLPQRSDSIARATPNFRIQAVGGKGK